MSGSRAAYLIASATASRRLQVASRCVQLRVFDRAKRQTCLAHLLRRIDGLLQICTSPQAQRWLQGVKRVLKRSITISQRRDAAEIGPHGLLVAIGKAEADVDRLRTYLVAKTCSDSLVTFAESDQRCLRSFMPTQFRRRTFSPSKHSAPRWSIGRCRLATKRHAAHGSRQP